MKAMKMTFVMWRTDTGAHDAYDDWQ